jgi:hypothetical protein
MDLIINLFAKMLTYFLLILENILLIVVNLIQMDHAVNAISDGYWLKIVKVLSVNKLVIHVEPINLKLDIVLHVILDTIF